MRFASDLVLDLRTGPERFRKPVGRGPFSELGGVGLEKM